MRLNFDKALALASALGTNPILLMASNTALRVASFTFSGLLSTRETVEMLTCAAVATSYIVGEDLLFIRNKIYESAFIKALLQYIYTTFGTKSQ